jgi:demethylspheroidene O-methyltransferase
MGGAARAMPAAGTEWLDRALAIRDRLLASAKFRRWASAFALTRPVARRRARALFDLCAGFVYSQILAACVQVRLFDILAEGPGTAAALALRLGLPLEGAQRLLDAAVALRLAARRGGGRFGLGPLGAAMVDNPGVSAMVAHHAMLYADLRDPVALLRGERGAGALAAYWPYADTADPARLSPRQVADYTALMAASQPLVADAILDAYPITRHRCLLDLGGGDGTFLASVAARAPGLKLILFDLPPVAARAQARLAAAGLGERAVAVGGDFRTDALPQGADVVALVRVIHDHDDATAAAILRAAHAALPAGGTVLLAEPMSGTPGAEPIGDAYFGFYLLAMGRGRPRTPDRLMALLGDAGFVRARRLRTHTPLLTGLIVAQRGEAASRV